MVLARTHYVPDEVLKHRRVIPVTGVRRTRHHVARETNVVIVLRLLLIILFEVKRVERLAIEPGPRRLEFEANRIAHVVVVTPLDSTILRVIFQSVLLGARGKYSLSALQVQILKQLRPEQEVLVDRGAERHVAVHLFKPRRRLFQGCHQRAAAVIAWNDTLAGHRVKQPQETYHRAFAVRHDVQFGSRMFAMNLFHRAMEPPDDVPPVEGELRDELHVAQVIREHIADVDLQDARFLGEEAKVLNHFHRIDYLLENFARLAEVGLSQCDLLRRRKLIPLFRKHRVGAGHNGTRPSLGLFQRTFFVDDLLGDVRPEHFAETNAGKNASSTAKLIQRSNLHGAAHLRMKIPEWLR